MGGGEEEEDGGLKEDGTWREKKRERGHKEG